MIARRVSSGVGVVIRLVNEYVVMAGSATSRKKAA
jgi:hypothetical protein